MKKIPPFQLIPHPLTKKAEALPKFKKAPEPIGSRHKLGGSPDFIQGGVWPDCPECGEQMSFYAQLDSINDNYCIADCGMIYVFVCFDCIEVKSFIEFY
ncbi:DUF1963 domain-containing protein [Mixta intestinalis]|jgi:hypothetical protein|uniref:DUF1963 domain-containing protein n=1 Tax=Mixta intestinalis TaxID=1615494 RepID=A0A6P1Q348_9GAMM|nr:DUF1963 domain-containing protein [Mixta intestinalis]QHM73336.1 hypothetical protein C7M51_03683 [Mixta intestinalis]